MTYYELLTWLRNNNWHQVRFSGNLIQVFRRIGNRRQITLTPRRVGVIQDPSDPNSPVSCIPIEDCFIQNNALYIDPCIFQPKDQ